MSNAQRAEATAKIDSSMRLKGVVVDFPSTRICDLESPATPPADVLIDSDFLTCEELVQQLTLGSVGEMQRDDRRPSEPFKITETETALIPPPSQTATLAPGNAALRQGNPLPVDSKPNLPENAEAPATPPPGKHAEPKKNWLMRWLFSDRSGQDKRNVARKPTPGLVAHFWTGGPPKSHAVRDISATGMYIITDERWYLGTQILITLTMTSDDGSPGERTITVLATAVRWGDDGVGLQFVRNPVRKQRQQQALLSDGADGNELALFVAQLDAAMDTGPPIKPGAKSKRR